MIKTIIEMHLRVMDPRECVFIVRVPTVLISLTNFSWFMFWAFCFLVPAANILPNIHMYNIYKQKDHKCGNTASGA